MNRALLLVGIPGIIVAAAYVTVGYGWRAGLAAGCIGAAMIGGAIWALLRKRGDARQ